jgi:hypothetical protein
MTAIHDSPVLRRAAASAALATLVGPSAAAAYAGQGLLEYARSYVIAPLGLFAIVVGVGAGMFRPELVRTAIWSAVICAFLFFVISAAPTLVNLLQTSTG